MKYEMIDLPGTAIIGKEGLCTKEKNAVQDLWQQANSNFSEIADIGIKAVLYCFEEAGFLCDE